MAAPAPEGFAVATGELILGFRSARIVAHAAAGRTVVAVLEGRVKAVTPRGESVIVAAGETLEAAKGEAPGAPAAADMKRLNPWWENIR
jgi:ferric-dicitrate binding protein FerR (iron transport regulator)